MIIRNRRKRESLLRTLLRPISTLTPPPGYRHVLSSERFQVEVNKEIDRSNRRSNNPEFAIVSLDFCDFKVNDTELDELIESFRGRLRVSDTIGWHQLKLSILLPETGKDGATLVVDSLDELATSKGIKLESSISIYPWDDIVIGEFTGLTRHWQDRPPTDNKSYTDGEELQFRIDGPCGGNDVVKCYDDGHGAVATLTAPKIAKSEKVKHQVVAQPQAQGTGTRYLFASARATPVWKRAVDVAGAAAGLLVLSPVFIAAATAIKLSSPGPVFFRQRREGKDGELFDILKFRTMVPDAEAKKAGLRELSEQDGPAFKLTDDPRVTVIGKYLRKSCIDELPQLVNVLTGTMSLVGPRPLPVDESLACEPWQRQRLAVLPGLTCIWQARGGRNTKFNEWMRMDMEYIRQRGLIHDLRLIGETAWIVVRHRGSV